MAKKQWRPREAVISLRVTLEERKQFERCAGEDERKLSDWVRLQCRRTAEKAQEWRKTQRQPQE